METGSFNGVWCMCSLTIKRGVSPWTWSSFSWPSPGHRLWRDPQQRTFVVTHSESCFFSMVWRWPTDGFDQFLYRDSFLLSCLLPNPLSLSLLSWMRFQVPLSTYRNCQFKWLHCKVILLVEKCNVCVSKFWRPEHLKWTRGSSDAVGRPRLTQ